MRAKALCFYHGLWGASVKAEICLQMRSDIFLVMMSFKEMILNVDALLLQNQIQLFTGAIELPLVILSVIQKHFDVVSSNCLRRCRFE